MARATSPVRHSWGGDTDKRISGHRCGSHTYLFFNRLSDATTALASVAGR
jgi:hypothetical protein